MTLKLISAGWLIEMLMLLWFSIGLQVTVPDWGFRLWFLSYSEQKTRWIMASWDMLSYLRLCYDFSVIFLPLKMRLKSFSLTPDVYKLFKPRTIYFNWLIFRHSSTVIFSPSPFSLRMYMFCWDSILKVSSKLVLFIN